MSLAAALPARREPWSPVQGYYYFAILTDLALRFGWTLSVSLTELGVIHSDLMVTILAPLEVFR